ncbi:hypothetical protein XEUV315_23935, partial [Xanthomonas euvesicatoria]
MKLDGYRYRGASASDADRMVREAYELARDHVMRGGEVLEPAATALPPPARCRKLQTVMPRALRWRGRLQS